MTYQKTNTFDSGSIFEPKLSDQIITAVSHESRVMAFGTKAEFDGNGLIIPIIGEGEASWVAEADKKVSNSAPTSVFQVTPHVLQRTVIFSEQLLQDAPALANKLIQEAKDSLSISYDRTVFGEITPPVGFDRFDDIATIVKITDYLSFRRAIAGNTEHQTDGIILNAALLNELYEVVNPNTGAPVFNITGDDYTTGTINGIRYAVVKTRSNTPVGYVGPWKRTFWGVVPGSVQIKPLEEVAYDELGNIQLLKARNLRGVLIEMRVGFRALDKTEFKKIDSNVVTEPAPTA